MKSIIQTEKECYICNSTYTEEHHIMFGTANRKLSEKYGLKVFLCPVHHRTGLLAVHKNHKTDLMLKQIAQKRFEEVYTREEFIKIFGKSYL